LGGRAVEVSRGSADLQAEEAEEAKEENEAEGGRRVNLKLLLASLI